MERFFSLDENFDLVLFRQDRDSFRRWVESMRDESTAPAMRETDAVICELAQYSLQRSFSRALPKGYKWSFRIDADGVSITVCTRDGREVKLSDGNLGVLIYRLEMEDFEPVDVPDADPAATAFRFVDVDVADPFERARAELILRRQQEAVS